MHKEKLLLKRQIIYLTIFIFVFTIFFVGSSMNFVAVMNNGGKMPVLFYDFEFESERHFSYTECSEVKHCYLTDIFPLGGYIFSIGDFFIVGGLIAELVIIVKILKTRKEINRLNIP